MPDISSQLEGTVDVDSIPQSPTPGMPKRGRAAIIMTPLSAFRVGVVDGLPIIPYDGEFCYDDVGDGSIGYIKYFENTWRFVSQAQNDSKYLQYLRDTGLFENALAGVVSKELTYFMFNPDKRTVIFNNKLVFPDTYCYYAIRKGTRYITRKVLPDNLGEMHMVHMRRILANADRDCYVRKPNCGILAEDAVILDGETYIVEFFDNEKRLIGRDVYHAEFAMAFTGAFNSAGISALRVTTERPYMEYPLARQWTTAVLYRDESIDQLNWMVNLVFDDGSTRDVTNESGLDVHIPAEFTTSNLTGDSPYRVVFTYTSDELGEGESLTETLLVYVIEDVDVTNISTILPVYWYDGGVENKMTDIRDRYLAFGDNTFTFFDVSLRLKHNSFLAPLREQGDNNAQFEQGRLYQNVATEFAIGANGGNLFRPKEYALLFDHLKGTTGPCVFRRYKYGDYTVDPDNTASPPGGNDRYIKDLNRFRIVRNPNGRLELREQLTADSTSQIDYHQFTDVGGRGLLPTHFQIVQVASYLNASGPHYFTSLREVGQLTDFQRDANSLPGQGGVPYIVEFLIVSPKTVDDGDDENSSQKIINAIVAYYQA